MPRRPNAESYLRRLLRDGSESFRRRNAGVEDQIAGTPDTKQKRGGRPPLEQEKPHKTGMVTVPDKVLVRITRIVPDKRHDQDDDNEIGGAKSLRDSIAALLGRKGDSEEDGMTWEYTTKYGPFAVEVDVFDNT